jgi:hypothetical protein
MNLTKSCKITVVEAAGAAAQTELVSDVLDMKGFDGVMFIALTGDVTVNSVLTLTAKGNTADRVSSPTPATLGATDAFTASATSADSKALVVDIFKPKQRYVFASLTRTAADAVIGGIIAIQYKAKKKPTAHAASVIASKFAVGPA